MNNQEILDYKYEFEDAEAGSLREYFKALLTTLWREDEGFSGKRPFGNSGWQTDVYAALVEMTAIKGRFYFYQDNDGVIHREGLEDYDGVEGNKLVKELIQECFK